MDEEEEERLKNEAMLLGQLRRDSMLPEQQSAQAPIAPAVQASVAEAPVTSVPIAASTTQPEATYTMPDGSVREIFPESTIPKGAVGSPQENFRSRMLTGEPLTAREIEQGNAFAASMGTTFNPTEGYSRDPYEQSIAPQMTGLRPVDPQTGEFLSQSVIAAGENAGLTFPSQVSVPMQQAPQAPIAPMGPEETRARMGGMTLNEYLNAPAGTPGVSGLRTDPQGRMITPAAPVAVNNFATQAPSGQAGPSKVPDEIMSQVVRTGAQTAEFRDGNRDGIEDREQGIFRPGELIGYDAQGNEVRSPGTQQPVNRIPATAQPPAGAFSDFELASLARQIGIGGTGSFAGDSEAREARLRENERRPGESQADRDTRVAQSKTTGGQTGGLSFDDARRRAEGQLAARGVKNPRASQVNALAKSIQAAEPGRLAEAEAKREQDAYDRALSIAAEARRVAAEERDVAAEARAVAAEERAVAGEERTVAAGIKAQEHAAKSQEQRDQEIKIKQSAENRQILAMQQTNPQAHKDATDAQTFMDNNNLIFDNGVLYQKSGWLNGTLTEVINPAFMNVKGMNMLQAFSRGATGSASPAPSLPLLGSTANTANTATSNAQGAPVDYSAFRIRPLATPAQGTPAAPPVNVTAPPVTATNNAVTQEALNDAAQPAVVDPSARRADETKTSYAMRMQREKNARRLSTFLAGR
jgi:hypothetical protein